MSVNNCIVVMQTLLKHDHVDVNQKGMQSGTPLHMAAQTDHDQCAYLLVSIVPIHSLGYTSCNYLMVIISYILCIHHAPSYLSVPLLHYIPCVTDLSICYTVYHMSTCCLVGPTSPILYTMQISAGQHIAGDSTCITPCDTLHLIRCLLLYSILLSPVHIPF